MDLTTLRMDWPATLPDATATGQVVLDLADDLVALHGEPDPATALISFEDGRVAVHRIDDVEVAEPLAHVVGPVYRQRPAGTPAVPTGRVLVRYPTGDRIERHRDELAAAGYQLEDVLGYAPQAGWVRGSSIGSSLAGLDRLAALEGVEHAEPQLLRERAQRR